MNVNYGHIWETAASEILLGSKSWCPVCAKTAKIDISVFHNIAKNKEGNCLTNNYNNQKDKLKFICKNNHIWEAKAAHIRAGHWCPNCNTYISEEICRFVFESIFEGFKFKKYKADWLVNKHGYKLELDGFCEELGIAFEHNGKQHYGFDIFNLGDAGMLRAKENDKIKKELCLLKGIKLIEIPELFTLTKPKNFNNWLSDVLESNNILNFSKNNLKNIKIQRGMSL